MSGDGSPHARIRAAITLLQERPNLHLLLIGQQSTIAAQLAHGPAIDSSRLTVVHAEHTVAMDDSPIGALRIRHTSSMGQAIELMASGAADACVSAGNTGALMAMGQGRLGKCAGLQRPALATHLPCGGKQTVLLDIGANVNCTAIHLVQFAVLGSCFATTCYGIECPTIGLLNVGTEANKGNEAVRLAHQHLQTVEPLHYVGYLEGHDLFTQATDVVVCDGFVGNIALKTAEGVAHRLQQELITTFNARWWRKGLRWALRPILQAFSQYTDPTQYNGALLLGLHGLVIKSHGGANERGFYQALQQAVRAIDRNILQQLTFGIEDGLLQLQLQGIT